MGEILKGLQAIKAGRDSAVSSVGLTPGGRSGYTGGIPPTGGVDMSQPQGVPDFGQAGQSQAQAQDVSNSYVVQPPQATAVNNAQPAPPPEENPYLAENPYNPNPYDTPKELAKSMGDEEEIEIEGDGWKPKHKETVLGKIADTLLMLRGRQPVFRPRVDAANLKDAAQGVGVKDDPEMFFNRVEKINPELAEQMRVRYHTAHARDELIAAQREAAQEKLRQGVRDRIAAGLYAVQKAPDPQAAYAKAKPIFDRQVQRFNLDPLPDTLDKDSIELFRAGSMTVDQQEDNDRIEQGQLRDDSRADKNTNSLISSREQTQARAEAREERLATKAKYNGLKPIIGLPENPKPGQRYMFGTGEHNKLGIFDGNKWQIFQKTKGKINKLGDIVQGDDGNWYKGGSLK